MNELIYLLINWRFGVLGAHTFTYYVNVLLYCNFYILCVCLITMVFLRWG